MAPFEQLFPSAARSATFAARAVLPGLLAVSVTVASPLLFRRKKGPTGPGAVAAPRPAGPSPAASLPAERTDAAISGGRQTAARAPPVPEYYEGPPDPPRSADRGKGTAAAPPVDLDELLARLDRLSEQMRRKNPARPASPSTDPSQPPEGA